MTFHIRRMRCLAGIPYPALVQGRDSQDIPLLGFNPPTRFLPETSVLHLSVQNHSLGVSFPFNALGNESPRPPRFTGLAVRLDPKTGSVAPTGPTPPTTVPLTGFLNLSATFSSHCPPAIFRQVAFMGFALQGFNPSTKPPVTHRHRTTLLSFLPPVAQPQGPRPGTPLGARSVT